MTFLSSSVVVVVMFLLSIIKVYIPSIERRMTVKELLNVVNSQFKPSGQSVFHFRIQKFSYFFRSSPRCSVVVKVFVTFSIVVYVHSYIQYIQFVRNFQPPPPFKAHTPVPACILFLNFSFPQPSVFQTVPPPSHRQPSYCPNPTHQHNSIPWT